MSMALALFMKEHIDLYSEPPITICAIGLKSNKKHLHPSANEECMRLYNESILVNDYLAIITAFFLRLRLASAPASPTKPMPSRATVVGSGTAGTAASVTVHCVFPSE